MVVKFPRYVPFSPLDAVVDIQRHYERRRADDGEIDLQFEVVERLSELAEQQKIIQVEVHAEYQHKDRRGDVDVGAGVMSD